MPLNKGKSRGWAAFHREHDLLPAADVDPYPPMPNSNNDSSARPFSSLLLPCPDSSNNKNFRKAIHAGDSSGKQVVDVLSHRRLKGIHCWADDGLIDDVLAATNNHVDKASSLLNAMVSPGSSKGNEKTDDVRDTTHFIELTSTLEDCIKENDNELMDQYASIGENSSNDAADAKGLVGNPRAILIEPEWIDDDIDMYLDHRKDAIRMMRLASQHSRAATNAYQRGDHFAAQQYSLKAQEERLTAERLNSKAAKEILSIRNSQNDVWKLDLHGLHAAEAVQAMQVHLLKIETQLPANRSISPNKLKMDDKIKRSSSLESFSRMNLGRLEKLQASTRQRQRALEVITGVGNHSQGKASLPIAVRSFLNENRYPYDETRPGVITVRPKFRQR